MPTRVSATPATSRAALPNRRVNRGMAMATAKFTTVMGRNARPAWSALKPRTPWRYWVVK
jgi:hypothetical protein